MINTELIAKHIDVSVGSQKGVCKMCGQETVKGFKSKDIIKDARFTNFDELKNIKSNVVCESCCACMKSAQLRRSSYIADEEKITYLAKNDIENYVFQLEKTVKGNFVVCVTESFKKHTSFKATVNTDTRRYVITTENYKFVFDVEKMKKVYDVMNKMYLYFSKNEILTGEYESFFISDYIKENSLNEFYSNEEILAQERGSNAFAFLIHILNSERKNEFMKEKKKCKKK